MRDGFSLKTRPTQILFGKARCSNAIDWSYSHGSSEIREAFGGSVANFLVPACPRICQRCQGACGVIDFKGVHYPKSVILHAVFFYVRYAVSYRGLEEILAERGVTVGHATLNRWVVKFALLIADRLRPGSGQRPIPGEWMRPTSR